MKVKKLKDRLGNVFTPLVHKDSVVDTNGVPLKKWIAPVYVNGTDTGYSSFTDFANGTHITVSNTRVVNADGSYHNTVSLSHNNVTRINTTSTQEPSSGNTVDMIDSVSTDSQGHVTGVRTKTVTMPTDVTVSVASDTVYVLGSTGKSGVNGVKATEAMTFNAVTSTLRVPLIDSELVGGNKGSVVYQSATDVTAMLPIGTQAQILSVSADGVPEWIDKVNGLVSQSSWTDGTTAGPIPVYTLEDGYNTTKTLNGTAIPSASASVSGIVTTTTQSFSGAKTFKGNVTVDGDLTVNGDIIAVEEKDIVVRDKVITLAATESATVTTGNGSGIEVSTAYNGTAASTGDKYLGPSFKWDKDKGWTTGNSDSTSRSTDINIGNYDSNTEGVLRINGVQVLSSAQYIGNAATADKVNHTLSFESKTFDGSADVTITLNDISGSTPLTVFRGGTGRNSLDANEIILGNGTDAVRSMDNGTAHQALVISNAGVPAYETLSLTHIPDVTFTLYEDSGLADVEDFAV